MRRLLLTFSLQQPSSSSLLPPPPLSQLRAGVAGFGAAMVAVRWPAVDGVADASGFVLAFVSEVGAAFPPLRRTLERGTYRYT